MIDQVLVEKLVKSFQKGDDTAFDKLYSLFYNRQYYFAFNMVRDAHAAQDMVQDVFLKIYQSIGTLTEPKAFSVWINQITYNHCLNYIDKMKRSGGVCEPLDNYEGIEADTAQWDPYVQLSNKERRTGLMEALDSLPIGLKSAVVLKYFSGMKESQIAAVLECPVGTVKSRLYNAKRLLSKSLKGIYCLVPFVAVTRALRMDAYAFCGVRAGKSAAGPGTTGAAVCAAAAVSLAVAVNGPQITSIELAVPGDYISHQFVKAELTSSLPIQTVQINGYDLKEENGGYSCRISENGIYHLTASDAGRRSLTYTFTVNNIDDEPPQVLSYEIADQTAVLTVADEKSGIDWANTKLADQNGRELPIEKKESAGLIILSADSGVSTLTLADQTGNCNYYKINIEHKAEGSQE